MNGDVVHSGGTEFTLINKLLSNEYITTHTQTNMGTVSSRSYNSSGAYNDNAIKISNVYASYPYYGRYKQTFNGTYTFTLPINITGNYTIEITCDDPEGNVVTSYLGSDFSFSEVMDINGNTISITISGKNFYTSQGSGKSYLRIIGLTKN